jgi:hypothetical protein
MNRYVNLGAVTGQMLVDRVIEDLKDKVMQTALIRIADIHSGALADGFQTFEFINLSGIVLLRFSDLSPIFLGAFLRGFVAQIFVGGGR